MGGDFVSHFSSPEIAVTYKMWHFIEGYVDTSTKPDESGDKTQKTKIMGC